MQERKNFPLFSFSLCLNLNQAVWTQVRFPTDTDLLLSNASKLRHNSMHDSLEGLKTTVHKTSCTAPHKESGLFCFYNHTFDLTSNCQLAYCTQVKSLALLHVYRRVTISEHVYFLSDMSLSLTARSYRRTNCMPSNSHTSTSRCHGGVAQCMWHART